MIAYVANGAQVALEEWACGAALQVCAGLLQDPPLILQPAALIQIDIPARRCQVRILLSLFQQLVEFLFEHLAVRFLHFELFAENLVAASCLTLQLGHRRRQIFDRGRLLGHCVRDYGPRLGIDLQNRAATGTLDLE